MPATRLTAAAAVLVGAACILIPYAASAGPCAEQISDIAKELSRNPSLGPVTSGALTGSVPGTAPKTAPQPDMPRTASDASGEKAGGEAGMREMNRSTSQIATSAQDVRLQQQGKPTVVQGGNPAEASSDPMARAKTQLEHARMLDSQNDQGCMDALGKVREMMRS